MTESTTPDTPPDQNALSTATNTFALEPPAEDPAEESTSSATTPAPSAAPAAPQLMPDDTLHSADDIKQEDNPTKYILPPLPDADKVEMYSELPISSPLSAAEKTNLFTESISLPYEEVDRMRSYLENIPNLDPTQLSEETIEWGIATREALEITPRFGSFVKSIKRPKSFWTQAVPSKKGLLASSIPKERADLQGVVTGAAALRQVHHALGLAAMLSIPLWHSGFWITLRTPAEGVLLDLMHRIAQDKVNMGRSTSGMVYSNMSVYMAEHVLNIAMDHVHTTTIKVEPGEVRKYIMTQDLQLLAWGLASVVWSRGFKYRRAVMDEEGKTDTIVEAKLNLSRMLFTDNSALTDWQRAHMSNRTPKSMSVESVQQYQGAFEYANGTRVEINPNTYVHLKVPTLDRYIASGTKWVSGIEQMVNTALGMNLENAERNRYIDEQGQAGIMRQFAHWVEKIELNGRFLIEDEKSIDEALTALSQDADTRKAYMTKVREYTDETTISCICIPAASSKEENVFKRHPRLVPLDALYTFFTLHDQRIILIQNRAQD